MGFSPSISTLFIGFQHVSTILLVVQEFATTVVGLGEPWNFPLRGEVVAAGRQNRGQRGARHGLWPAVHGALLETHPVSQRRPRRDRCLVSDGEVMGMIWVKHQQYTYIYTSSTAQGGGGSFKNRKPIGEVGCCESGMAEQSH